MLKGSKKWDINWLNCIFFLQCPIVDLIWLKSCLWLLVMLRNFNIIILSHGQFTKENLDLLLYSYYSSTNSQKNHWLKDGAVVLVAPDEDFSNRSQGLDQQRLVPLRHLLVLHQHAVEIPGRCNNKQVLKTTIFWSILAIISVILVILCAFEDNSRFSRLGVNWASIFG